MQEIVTTVCDGILAFTGWLYLAFAYVVGGQSLPNISVCIFHLVTSMHCPLCGMTRSFGELLHGRIDAALCYHRLAIFLLVLWVGFTLVFSFCAVNGTTRIRAHLRSIRDRDLS
jgi:hypothetical protein